MNSVFNQKDVTKLIGVLEITIYDWGKWNDFYNHQDRFFLNGVL